MHTEDILVQPEHCPLLALSNVHKARVTFALGLLFHILAGGIGGAEVDIATVIQGADGAGDCSGWGGVREGGQAFTLVQVVQVNAAGILGAFVVFFPLTLVESVSRETLLAGIQRVQVAEAATTLATVGSRPGVDALRLGMAVILKRG